jgi:hypothetical protein
VGEDLGKPSFDSAAIALRMTLHDPHCRFRPQLLHASREERGRGSSQRATEGNGETGRGEVTTRVTTGDRVADELIAKASRVLLKREVEARATGGRLQFTNEEHFSGRQRLTADFCFSLLRRPPPDACNATRAPLRSLITPPEARLRGRLRWPRRFQGS